MNPEDNLQAQALLPTSVQVALEDLYGTGLVQRTELDGKVSEIISSLSVSRACPSALTITKFAFSGFCHLHS